MSRQQPQNARESREYLAQHYAREAADRTTMANLASQSGFKNVEENLRNLASRSATYSRTARRMNGDPEIVNLNHVHDPNAHYRRMPSFGGR